MRKLDFRETVWQSNREQDIMATNPTYTDASNEARAGIDPSLLAVNIRAGRTLAQELTVAKIIEIEAQKISGLLGFGRNKSVTSLPTILWVSERTNVSNASNAATNIGFVSAEINKIEQASKKEPIEKTVLENLEINLDTIWTTPSKTDAICSSRDTIILFASVKKAIQERLTDAPTMTLANIRSTLPGTITDIPFTIEWDKWADEMIEILDSSDRVLDSFPGSPADTNFLCDKITDLKNWRNKIKIRSTNITKKLYSEYVHTCIVDVPEAPINFNQNINITALPAVITGTLKNRSHGIQLLKPDGTTVITQFTGWALLAPGADWETIQIFGDGSFRIEIPHLVDGTHNYQLWVKWTGATPLKLPFTVSANLATLPTDVPPETPEGIQRDIEITTEPHTISGKLKNPKHSIELLDDAKWPIVPAVRPTIGPDGTFSFQLPLCGSDRKKKYWIRVDNKNPAGWPTNQLDIEINVSNKAPVKKVGVIKWYDIKSLTEKAKKTWSDQIYKIKGHPDDFRIGYTKQKWDFKKHFYAQVPDEHNHFHVGPINTRSHSDEYVRANSPEELEKKIYERLHHINHHMETEYNSALGIAEDEKSHDDTHDKDSHKWEKHEKGEKHEKEEGKAHEKGDHGDHASEAKWGKFVGVVKAVWKTAAWPVGGALAGLGYAAWAGGAVLLGPAVVGGAVAGASIWAIRRLWRIKNPKKWGGEEKAHH